MKKRNKIILCICSILVIMASIFSFIPFKADNMTVSADTVTEEYYYNGSNIVSKTTFDNGSSSINILNPIFSIKHITGAPNTKRLTLIQELYLIAGNSYTFSTDLNFDIYSYSIQLRSTPSGVIGGSVYLDTSLINSSSYTFSVSTSAYFAFMIAKDDNSDFTSTDMSDYYFQLQEGSSASEYVLYNPNHYLNFDFDFNTLFDSSTNLLNVTMKPTINNELNYTRVSNTNNSSIQSNYTFSTNTKGVLSTNTFSAYNSDTQVLDNNYIFKIKYMLDYIDSSGYDNTTNFNANISYIVLGSYLDARTYFLNEYLDNEIFTSKYNFISYVDINNNNLNIFIPLDSNITSDYFTFRTYYTSAGNNDSYLEGVNVGYSNGFINGQKEGETIGYNKGYNIGYNVGLNDSNQYTFLNLISATIDAPISYFQSLFNFELLGVNLQGFITGLFTLCVIVTIIKLCLGR